MAQMQTERHVEFITPLGEDVLLFKRMSVSEELGRMFQIELELLSKKPDIKFDELLGQNVTVRLELPDRKKRYFNGFVSRFNQSDTNILDDEYTSYSVSVCPWLWFLTRTADCRIFQNKKAPDIIKKIFREHGFTDFEDKLTGSYREWEYCVQYRETDFNFVSRLMEQEGIYYFFKHEENKHTLVMADDISAHAPYPDYEEIPYFPPDESMRREREHVSDWTISQELKPGVYALNEFNFKKPKANLEVKAAVSRDHVRSDMEIFDYPGEYTEADEGETYVRTRIEELQAQYEQIRGQTNARGIAAGHLFTLAEYPRADQNREYLVVSAAFHIESNAFSSGSGGGGEDYSCSFTALESRTVFRSVRSTPKPLVQGPQTAVVTGKAGEEIWTEKYGRVKIQFNWDRYGKKDENSSCWVRVSHPTAGKGWGAVQIPRIGQEVIVDFLEGDPDHPIITGRVYNNDNMPPYALPACATQSGMKSRSSKGGNADNFNEFRFEDKKGQEEIYLHGEKDWNINIENNKNQTIGSNETLSVGNNRDKTVTVDQSETIGNNKTINVGANHTETVSVVKAVTIGAAYQITVGAAMNETVGAAKAEEIGAVKSVNVGSSSSENVGGSKSVNAGKNISESAGKDVSITSGKKMALTAGDDFSVTGKKKGVIDIKDQLTIKVGKASITMKKNGDITIKGKKINVKGSGNIVMKAKKILEN